jgi:hypothetical protein
MTATAQPARLLGIPLGDFGFFSTILLALVSGFLAFWATCFVAIVSLLVWNAALHHHIDYADSYRYIALPTGLAVMAASFVFLVAVWLRRKLSAPVH